MVRNSKRGWLHYRRCAPGLAPQSVPMKVLAIPLPPESRVVDRYPRTDLADAFAVDLPEGTISDPEALARFVLAQQPGWVAALMKLRDLLVAGFGLKTAAQLQAATGAGTRRIHIFRIYETHAREIVLGEDDRHLDFRLSLLYRPPPPPPP